MGFTFVVVKEHTRATVHLGNDHPLGAVHNECAVWRHQGHVAHEHVLFFDVLDRLGAGIFINIKHNQAEGYLERRAICHVALHTFFYVVFWLFQRVLAKFKHSCFVEILDREHRLENTLDAIAIGRGFVLA